MRSVCSLIELLQRRAADTPDRVAFTYAERGVRVSATLTHAELHRLACVYATQLREHVRDGERVLLLFPAGLEFIVAFFASIYARAVPVPCYPPSKRETDWARLAGIDRDCEPSAALTTTPLVAQVMAGMDRLGAERGARIPVLGVSLAPEVMLSDADNPCGASAQDIAFLQYTSGSTGHPKGVMVSQANLLANLRAIHERFAHSTDSQGLIWLPAHHDMGLIGGVLAPLYGGFPVQFMSPLAFLQSPMRWLEAVAAVRATTSGGPNFAYAKVLKRIAGSDVTALDLSCWRVAFMGAEPIDASVVDAFCQLLAPARFSRRAVLPCYGLAEATLLVTSVQHQQGPRFLGASPTELARDAFEAAGPPESQRQYVSCGPVNDVDEIAIVDAETLELCPERKVGEIWVRGPSVAQGYWGKPELSSQTFGARLADGRGPYLRTKDRGCLCGGELVVTGRAADMIIVRGRNHYAEDVEAAARSAGPNFQDAVCAVFAGDELSDKFVLVMEMRGQRLERELHVMADALRERVCDSLGVAPADVRLVRPGSIPRTTSGKVQRRRCRELYLSGELSTLEESKP